MTPKDISPSDVQKWTREIVIMLASLAGTGSYADIAYARKVLAKRNLTPEALFYLRIGLKSEVLNLIVAAKSKEGSYSETGNDHLLVRAFDRTADKFLSLEEKDKFYRGLEESGTFIQEVKQYVHSL